MIHQPLAFPRTVYLCHWFPKASETFVFAEIEGLFRKGFPVSVFTLYGRLKKDLDPRMLRGPAPVEHLGVAALPRVLGALLRALWREPGKSLGILSDIFIRRWRDVEMRLENAWAGLCGFYLAERFRALGARHVHAAWGNGPATAAWVAQRLTGIPFSFSARADDVCPPDGALAEKVHAAAFVRVNNSSTAPRLEGLCPQCEVHKCRLVYNPLTLAPCARAAVPMEQPVRLLGIGRLVETKGFRYAVEAVGLLLARGVQATLTLAGAGSWHDSCENQLRRTIRDLRLESRVRLCGHVPHDRLGERFRDADILLMPSVTQPGTGKSDGLPNVIVEAMLHGVPVISTAVAGIGDVVRHGETGLLVPERDAPALADAVQSLVRDREKAMAMAARAETLVTAMFDPDVNLDKLMALFAKHAEAGGARL